MKNLKKISLVTDYLKNHEKTNDQFNKSNEIDETLLINGQNQTNLGVFRFYLESYLKKNSFGSCRHVSNGKAFSTH